MKRARSRLKKKFGDSIEVNRVGGLLLIPTVNRMFSLDDAGKVQVQEMDSALFPGVKRMRRRVQEAELVEGGYVPDVRIPGTKKRSKREREAARQPQPTYSVKELAARIREEFKKLKIREIATGRGTSMMKEVSWVGFSLPLVRRQVLDLESAVPTILERFKTLKPGLQPTIYYFDQHDFAMMLGPLNSQKGN